MSAIKFAGALPPLQSTWEEIARPGHTVRVLSVTSGRYPSVGYMVTYEHIGAANKRVQRAHTISEVRNFLRRYAPTDPTAVEIVLLEAQIEKWSVEREKLDEQIRSAIQLLRVLKRRSA